VTAQQRMSGIITLGHGLDHFPVDGSKRIVLFNAAAERMFRCSAAGRPWGSRSKRFIPEWLRFRARRHTSDNPGKTGVGPIGRHGKATGLAYARYGAMGQEFQIEASISADRKSGNNKLSTVILRDITEPRDWQKKAVTASRKRGSARLFRRQPAGSHDFDRKRKGGYLDVKHPPFLKLLGYQRQEVIGHTCVGLDFWAKHRRSAWR